VKYDDANRQVKLKSSTPPVAGNQTLTATNAAGSTLTFSLNFQGKNKRKAP